MGRSYTNPFSSNDESSNSFEIDWDVCSFETLQSNPIVELLAVESGRLCKEDDCYGKWDWEGVLLPPNCFAFNLPSFETEIFCLLPAIANIDVLGI